MAATTPRDGTTAAGGAADKGAAGQDLDPAQLEAACAAADVHPLLCAVAEVTGDLSLLRDEFAPDQLALFVPGAGLGAEAQAEARALAAAALGAHLAAGHRAHLLDQAELREVYSFLTGSPRRAARWQEFLTEELAPVGTDPRHPSWHTAELGRAFRCAVIGAGASGIAAAHRLQQAGVEVTVFEKNADVGGTWLENVYPGCRVDVPNRLYSFSFAQSNDWVSQYSAQPDLLDYLRRVAKDTGVRGCIRFSSDCLLYTSDAADE